jgi:hypothetical protein
MSNFDHVAALPDESNTNSRNTDSRLGDKAARN